MNEQLHKIRHTTAHVLAHAVKNLFPGAKIALGPVTDDGFFYDFRVEGITPADFPKLEKEMHAIIDKKIPVTREEVTFQEAKNIFKDEPYKLHIISEIESGKRDNLGMDGSVSIYTVGAFVDLCKGPHVENTSELGFFKLMSISGAYFQGKEDNDMLLRIHGTAFERQEELDEYLTMLEEAKKRDHRKLGKELDLFVFSELVGPGLPLWTPRGSLVRNILDDTLWQMRKHHGYQRVTIPHITKSALYEKSGHWAKYKDDLFKIETREGNVYAMKPMNCPHHAQIYHSRQRSYRELPLRFSETTMVYRDEQSGELNGLSRVLSITQDDAHVFCRESQITSEVEIVRSIIEAFYAKFGFTLIPRLSRRDATTPEKYMGDPGTWDKAEAALKKVIDDNYTDYIDGPGEASFYGPKIDFMAKDSLGRTWQVATIQLDFVQPKNLELFCINEQAQKEQIVMIHCAVMGSLERFISILLEHTAGNLPAWLAPVQVLLLPVSEDKHGAKAQEVQTYLVSQGVRAEIYAGDSLGKRIRGAILQKVPFFAILGDKELESWNADTPETFTLSVRKHGDEETKQLTIPIFINQLH